MDGGDELTLKLSKMVKANPAKEILKDTLRHMEFVAKSFVPQRTGNLFRSISSEGPVTVSPSEYVGSVSAGDKATAPYAIHVEKGTGIYGYKKSPFTSPTGNFMVFEDHGRTVFALKIRGQEGQHYIRKTFEEARDFYVPYRVREESFKYNL